MNLQFEKLCSHQTDEDKKATDQILQPLVLTTECHLSLTYKVRK